jgi:TonB family protein
MKIKRQRTALSEINVTPLVDVMLVLLIIFMVTAPLMQQGIDVNLPRAKGKELPPEERLTIVIKKGGSLFMNEQRCSLRYCYRDYGRYQGGWDRKTRDGDRAEDFTSMKTDSIHNSVYYSLGLHSFFFIVVAAYILISGPSHKAASIVVSLVESPSKGATIAPREENIEPVAEEPAPTITKKPEPKKSIANDRIAALEAKKRVERSASARRPVSISKSSSRAVTSSASGGDKGGGTYESLIMGRITRNWATADFQNKNKGLVAVINIRIMRNGSVTILGWEKKSGNPLFDREALRAINDSSPLPPPPGEIERSIRFNP